MRLKIFNNRLEQLFQQSRNLSDEDFEKFLYNLEMIKKNTIEMKRRKKSELIETKTFREFLIM